MELSEATKIIFMGYSNPSADFEMRQLLSRTVRHNASITIVLRDRPAATDANSHEYRYKSFWGKRNISFNYDGVENFIDSLIRKHTQPANQGGCRYMANIFSKIKGIL